MTEPHTLPLIPFHQEWFLQARFRLTGATALQEQPGSYRLLFAECPGPMLIASSCRHGSMAIDGVVYNLSPDKALGIQPGQRVGVDTPAGCEQTLYLLTYELSVDGQEADKCLGTEFGPVSSPERLQALCNKIADNWHTSDAVDRLASEAGFQDLLHLLFKQEAHNEDHLERTKIFMERHYSEAITVDVLAKLAGMSRYYFMRSFKERYGQSAMDYLTEVRMNESRRLLAEGWSLRHIAEKVGYREPQYLSSQFSKHVGISPSIYISNRKLKVAAYSWPNIGHLLTLQIIPYAAPIDQHWTDEYRKKYSCDVKVPLSHDYRFNREALRRAQPDKIVALDEMVTDEEKQKLREIAPALFLPWYEESWRTHLRMTARFLEREQEGEQWLASYDKKAADIRARVPLALRQGSLLIVNVTSSGLKVRGKKAGTVLYDDLHMASAEGVEQIRYASSVEPEQLESFQADNMLVQVMRDAQAQENWRLLQQAEAWRELKAVRNRRVFPAASPAWIAEPELEYTANRHGQFLLELDRLFSAFQSLK